MIYHGVNVIPKYTSPFPTGLPLTQIYRRVLSVIIDCEEPIEEIPVLGLRLVNTTL